MKAKELAVEFNQVVSEGVPEEEVLVKIALKIALEMSGIIKNRNPARQSALLSIFREQNDKWKAFARRVHVSVDFDLNDYWIIYMRVAHYETFKVWCECDIEMLKFEQDKSE